MSRAASEIFCLELAEAVPGLIPLLEEHVSLNHELLPYVFFGDLCRYAEGKLRANDQETLRVLLGKLESGLRDGDPDVDNLISLSFVEWFLSEPSLIGRLRESSGPLLQALIDLMSN